MEQNSIKYCLHYQHLFYLLLLTFYLTSCYDDGPLISFRSANKRVDGTYEVEKFKVGGVDSTITYLSKSCYSPILFRYDNKAEPQGIISIWNNGIPCLLNGEWSINGNKINLKFEGNYPQMGPWGGFNEAKWEVKELEDKKMTFEINSNSILYTITLIEI